MMLFVDAVLTFACFVGAVVSVVMGEFAFALGFGAFGLGVIANARLDLLDAIRRLERDDS